MSNSEDHFKGYQVRPRFKIETSYSADQVVDKINKALEKPNIFCQGQVHARYATIYISPGDQHYWSPQLSLSIEETEDGSIVRGLYGPRPVVWTMFIFFYSIIGVAILFIGVMGLSYLAIGKPATILWLVPIFLMIFLTLFLVAYFGQKLGQRQMLILHRFIEDCMGFTIKGRDKYKFNLTN